MIAANVNEEIVVQPNVAPVAPQISLEQYYSEAGPDYEAWSREFNMHFGYYRVGANPLRPSTKLLGVTRVLWQVEHARALNEASGCGERVDVIEGDYEQMSLLPSSCYDGVYAVESSCHAHGSDKGALLGEAHRLLRWTPRGHRWISCQEPIRVRAAAAHLPQAMPVLGNRRTGENYQAMFAVRTRRCGFANAKQAFTLGCASQFPNHSNLEIREEGHAVNAKRDENDRC